MSLSTKSREEATRRVLSFRYAFEGWWYVLRTQHNTWIHATASIAVFCMCLWLGIDRVGWAIIILTVMIVWITEFLNTAIEAVVDMVSPDYHPLAKVAKDVAAAGVLLGAVGSVLVGLLILGPPLWAKLQLLFRG
ncbi:MAG: diacylglycerol kinase family protein [Chloroflexota bacterium]